MKNISTLNYKGQSHLDACLKYKLVQFDDLGSFGDISELALLCEAPEIICSVSLVPRSRLKLKGDRAFSVAGHKLCSESQTISSFKSLLKANLLMTDFNHPG